LVTACGSNPGPRLIPGGGIGDGAIDGKLNVYVIDNYTKDPIANATVGVGGHEGTTDGTGLVVFDDLHGPQTIAVKATSYRMVAWIAADGANVTIPLTIDSTTPDQATLTGSITGWDTVTVAANHFKAAAVFYSQTDNLGDNANNIMTPNNGNICGVNMPTCNWTLVSRTGSLTVVAAILDRDTKGTADPNDDTTSIIGWAMKTGVAVDNGVNQSGLVLSIVDPSNLETVTVDMGTPPTALPQTGAFVGIEVSDDEVIQLPLVLNTNKNSILAPNPSVFGTAATFRLTAVAQTTSTNQGPQSIVLRQGLTTTSLAAGDWLSPPTGVMATRTNASFDAIANATVHTVNYDDVTGKTLLEMSVFDNTILSVDVPALVAIPTGTLTARVGGIGADLDVHDFSLDTDKKLLWGICAEPVAIP
jgi:hypothetical protein